MANGLAGIYKPVQREQAAEQFILKNISQLKPGYFLFPARQQPGQKFYVIMLNK